MNEQDLQKLFIDSLLSGEIQGIDEIIDIPSPQKAERIVRIKKEAYFRYFDLVLGIISLQRNLPTTINIKSIDMYDRYHNLTMRTSELLAFAREENCRVDCFGGISQGRERNQFCFCSVWQRARKQRECGSNFPVSNCYRRTHNGDASGHATLLHERARSRAIGIAGIHYGKGVGYFRARYGRTCPDFGSGA